MSDHGITCGACGATNVASAVVCAACGALLAAYATPAGAGDEPAPPAPATARSSVAPPAPPAASSPTLTADDVHGPAEHSAVPVSSSSESPSPAAVEEQPALAAPAGVPDQARPAEPRVTEIAAPVEPLRAGDAPTGARQVPQPANQPAPPLDEPAEPEPAIPAVRADTPAPEWTTTAFGPESGDATPDGPPRTFEVRWERQWSTRWEPPSNRRARLTMTGRPGMAPSTGVPRLDRLNEWGPGQLLMFGIGLLLGSCGLLAIGTAVEGGGCLLSLAVLGGAIGVLLTITAARTLFGNAVDGE